MRNARMCATASFVLTVFLFALFPSGAAIHPKSRAAAIQKIRAAKLVFFEDQTGAATVGPKTLETLKKWGKFQFVQDRASADLILLLSADPYKGGNIILSGGQTGSVGSGGEVEEDRVPNFTRAAPVRYAYLTVIDPKSGEPLWSASHHWGGLLTGFNSAGARLVGKLKKEIK
jgi:hypothetical protein